MHELDDLYGSCKLGEACICMQPKRRTIPIEFPEWLGRFCYNWQPLEGELFNALRKAHNKADVKG